MSAERIPGIDSQPDLDLRGLVYTAIQKQTDIPPRSLRANQTLFFTGVNGDHQGEGHSSVAGKLSFAEGVLRKVVVAARVYEESDELVEQCDTTLYVRRAKGKTVANDGPDDGRGFEVCSTVCQITKLKQVASFMVPEAAYDSWEDTSGWRTLTSPDIRSVKSVLDQADRWKSVSILNILAVYNQLRVV